MKSGVEPPADPSGDTIFGKIIRGELPCDKVRAARPQHSAAHGAMRVPFSIE